MTGPAVIVSVVTPVRNERGNFPVLVRMLRSVLDVPYEVLAIYDDPDDDTVPVAAALGDRYGNVLAVRNRHDKGVSGAIRTGVEQAHGSYVVILTADDVVPVLALTEMLELATRGCEFISCTRYAYGGRRVSGSISGWILSRTANAIFHHLVGSRFSDSTTGLKMFRREIFPLLELHADVGWAIAFEMSIKAEMHGLLLGEVPVISADRLYGGRSSFRLGPWFWAYLRLFVWGVTHLRQRRNRTVVMRPALAFASRYGSAPR